MITGNVIGMVEWNFDFILYRISYWCEIKKKKRNL